jgi:hypothetical protein
MNKSSVRDAKFPKKKKKKCRKLCTGLELPLDIIFQLISWLSPGGLLCSLLGFQSARSVSRDLSTGSQNDEIYSL